MHWSGLSQIQSLALRQAVDDVHEDDVAELLLDGVLGDGGADVAGAHHRDLGSASEQCALSCLTARHGGRGLDHRLASPAAAARTAAPRRPTARTTASPCSGLWRGPTPSTSLPLRPPLCARSPR